jgi:hypothetical protein
MTTTARTTAASLALAAALACGTVLAPPATAANSRKTTAVAYAVPGYCSFKGGFQTNLDGIVDKLRVTVVQPKRAGGKLKVRVSVRQRQQVPFGQYYPTQILRGEVVVKVAGKRHRLIGPVNDTQVAGTIFPDGWTARGSLPVPDKTRYKVVVKQIVYNVRGGGSGGWGTKRYRGFDLLCSGGFDPHEHARTYTAPRLKVRLPGF